MTASFELTTSPGQPVGAVTVVQVAEQADVLLALTCEDGATCSGKVDVSCSFVPLDCGASDCELNENIPLTLNTAAGGAKTFVNDLLNTLKVPQGQAGTFRATASNTADLKMIAGEAVAIQALFPETEITAGEDFVINLESIDKFGNLNQLSNPTSVTVSSNSSTLVGGNFGFESSTIAVAFAGGLGSARFAGDIAGPYEFTIIDSGATALAVVDALGVSGPFEVVIGPSTLRRCAFATPAYVRAGDASGSPQFLEVGDQALVQVEAQDQYGNLVPGSFGVTLEVVSGGLEDSPISFPGPSDSSTQPFGLRIARAMAGGGWVLHWKGSRH